MCTDHPVLSTNPAVTLESRIGTVIAKIPGAIGVMHAHNVDTCCAEQSSLAQAAAQHP